MAAATDPSVLGGGDKLLALVKATLCSHSPEKHDWELVRCACLALKRAAKSSRDGKVSNILPRGKIFFFPAHK